VDAEREIREFLISRRARVTPERVGLPVYGRQRRVPGLRREEAAMLAGVSVDYYNRLERGHVAGASDHVLDGIVRALLLDDAERAHLFDLVRAVQGTSPPRRGTTRTQVRASMRWMLDGMSGCPAFLRNRRLDILAANPLGRALYSVMYDAPDRPVNICRFVFLNPGAPEFFIDWEASATQCVAVLRAHAGHDPEDRGLSDLVAQLSAESDAFHARWAGHDVRFHDTGVKRLHHPAVGDLSLSFNRMEVSADPGLTIIAYAPQPGSRDERALKLLAAWAATRDAHSPRPALGA
jgi:MmyB-like transcription regulator ligand binding domain/Helix-turn-helix domain